MRKIPFDGVELTSQRVRGLRGTSQLPGRPAVGSHQSSSIKPLSKRHNTCSNTQTTAKHVAESLCLRPGCHGKARKKSCCCPSLLSLPKPRRKEAVRRRNEVLYCTVQQYISSRKRKKCRKERVGLVAANPDDLESNKEAGGGAQGNQGSSENCTSRESVSPLSRLIRSFRNKYH